MEDLITLRNRVTELDQQLIELLAKRRQLVLQIGQIKLQHHLPLRDRAREQSLLESLIAIGQQQQLESHYIQRLFRLIIQNSIASQSQYRSRDLSINSYFFDIVKNNKVNIGRSQWGGSYTHLQHNSYKFSKMTQAQH